MNDPGENTAPPDVSVIVTRPRGPGRASARNAGVDAAPAPLLAFTDADCAPEPGWLEAGVPTVPTR